MLRGGDKRSERRYLTKKKALTKGYKHKNNPKKSHELSFFCTSELRFSVLSRGHYVHGQFSMAAAAAAAPGAAAEASRETAMHVCVWDHV